jgi:hypothetical protein
MLSDDPTWGASEGHAQSPGSYPNSSAGTRLGAAGRRDHDVRDRTGPRVDGHCGDNSAWSVLARDPRADVDREGGGVHCVAVDTGSGSTAWLGTSSPAAAYASAASSVSLTRSAWGEGLELDPVGRQERGHVGVGVLDDAPHLPGELIETGRGTDSFPCDRESLGQDPRAVLTIARSSDTGTGRRT